MVLLVHLGRLSQSVHRHVGESTEVDHRRVAAGRGDVVGTVARVSAGVRTVVAVEVNIDEHHVGTGSALATSVVPELMLELVMVDSPTVMWEFRPSMTWSETGTVSKVSVCDRNRVLGRGTGTGALERFKAGAVHDHGPAATGHRKRIDVKVRHVNGFGDNGGTAHRDVVCGDVREGTWVDALHRDVASGDGVKDSVSAGWTVAGLRPATGDEPQVSRTEVNVRHGDAAHGVDAGVGVAVHVHVVEDHVGTRAEHRVNGHTGLSRWVGDGHVRDGDVLQSTSMKFT